MSDVALALPNPVAFSRQAETDAQLIELWVHGLSVHTELAYRKDAGRFMALAPP